MRFAWLQGLYLLLVLGGAVLLRLARRRGYFGHSLLFYLGGRLGRASRLIWLPALLEWVGFGFLFVAVLDPVVPLAEHEVAGEGLDIVLVIDLSSSMQQRIRLEGHSGASEITRMEAVRRAALDFVLGRKHDRIGLVVFSANAYVVTPMTTDRESVIRYLRMIDTRTLIGEGLTSIGEGIHVAANLLLRQAGGRAGEAKGKAIVVFTDAEQNYGRKPSEPLRAARASGFKVYLIGVDVKSGIGREIIAGVEATGGKYFDVSSAAQLRRAARAIDSLEKTRLLTRRLLRDAPAFAPYALAGFALFFTAAALRLLPCFVEIS